MREAAAQGLWPAGRVDRSADAELVRLQSLLATSDRAPSAALAQLIDQGADRLPLPGGGRTLDRWRALAVVAAHDLSLVKLFEGHTDALAILAELQAGTAPPCSRWGVWAAEPPQARVTLQRLSDDAVSLGGRKAWCSGAASLTHALMTCWERGRNGDDQGPFLVAVELDQPGVAITREGWCAVGMAASASVEVVFDQAHARVIGGAGAYLRRRGFWQGGAGIAACWYGAAAAVAEPLRRRVAQHSEAHAAAHLGAVDVALAQAAALLREAAIAIDRDPQADAQLSTMRVRAAVEHCATQVLDHVGRALGAGPFCRDADFARRAADLPVFLRQSHAERDLQALGELLTSSEISPWAL